MTHRTTSRRDGLRALIPALVTALALVATITPAAAAPGDPGEPIRLNPELRGDRVDVFGPQVTPDGSMVVFGARTDAGWAMWSVDVGGGTPVQLVDRTVVPTISPTSDRIVYRLFDNSNETSNAWTVPVGGGTAVMLNETLDEGDEVENWAFTPDGTTVVLAGDAPTGTDNVENYQQARAVPSAGGSPTVLDTNDVRPRFVWAMSPTGTHVAVGDSSGEFAVTPVDGTDDAVTVDVVGNPLREQMVFTPDGSRVVFTAFAGGTESRFSLWSAPVDGGAPVQLSMTPDHRVRIKDVEITPDGSTVIYRADDGPTDNVTELRAVPIGGGTPTTLNGALPDGSDVRSFMLSPDGTTVVYRADQNVDRTQELWSVPVGGGTPVRLNGGLPANGDVRPVYDVSADSTTVVYRADQRTNNVAELFAVPIGGGTATRISGDLVTDGDVFAWRISPDSDSVVYRAEQDTDRIQELYAVAIGGGATTKLAGPEIERGDVKGWIEITADSERVIFTGDLVTDGQIELWSVDLP